MARDEKLVTGDGGALAVCLRTERVFAPRSGRRRRERRGTTRAGQGRWAASAVDFSARAGFDLLLRLFLAGFSNQRIDRAAGASPRGGIPTRSVATVRPRGLLVRANSAVVFERAANARGALLGRDDRFGPAGFEFVAAGDARDLLCVFPFVRERGARFFGVSIGRNAAGSGVHFAVLCAPRMAARVGQGEPALTCKLVSAGLGVLPHLLR